MINVFLSRPNWISSEYQEGLDAFIELLKSHQLNPRTIGSTDYPSKSPMDGVIELLEQCHGAIILGFPQIFIRSGKVKNQDIEKDIVLGTEWNHIEAGLAYASGLPLLVIHDQKVTRGIFDRGVLNSFLYSKDLTDKSWPVSKEIIGCLTSWKSKLSQKKNTKNTRAMEEEYSMKWGCLLFHEDPTLYCPVCYKKDGLKMPTSRTNTKFRQCPNCKATLA